TNSVARVRARGGCDCALDCRIAARAGTRFAARQTRIWSARIPGMHRRWSGRRPIRQLSDARATLVYVYRGDYCPFARFELAELTARAGDFGRAGIDTVAISADPIERSKMLAGFLRTKIPLLSDSLESILAPLGLVQHHRNAEPDNAIPAFFIVDRNGVVR